MSFDTNECRILHDTYPWRNPDIANFLKLWPARFVEGEPGTGDLWPEWEQIFRPGFIAGHASILTRRQEVEPHVSDILRSVRRINHHAAFQISHRGIGIVQEVSKLRAHPLKLRNPKVQVTHRGDR